VRMYPGEFSVIYALYAYINMRIAYVLTILVLRIVIKFLHVLGTMSIYSQNIEMTL
jgi:hypothetical protein